MEASSILNALIAVSSGSIWASELRLFSGDRRIDFWTLEPTRSQKFRTSAYEIKVSRGDFRRDSEEKQDWALKYSDRFWYATPPAMLALGELPAWAGLIEWDGSHFAVRRKAPPRQKHEPDWEFIVALLRNSGDRSRDVSLLKTQVKALQHHVDALNKQQEIYSRLNFERFVRKHTRPC